MNAPRSWLERGLWLIAIWALSVAALGALAWILRVILAG